jgi:hypothetical protein
MEKLDRESRCFNTLWCGGVVVLEAEKQAPACGIVRSSRDISYE